jgi:hypothetical protein
MPHISDVMRMVVSSPFDKYSGGYSSSECEGDAANGDFDRAVHRSVSDYRDFDSRSQSHLSESTDHSKATESEDYYRLLALSKISKGDGLFYAALKIL